jgi:hypothetical protein
MGVSINFFIQFKILKMPFHTGGKGKQYRKFQHQGVVFKAIGSKPNQSHAYDE